MGDSTELPLPLPLPRLCQLQGGALWVSEVGE